MRPLDPRLLPHLRPARTPLAVAVVAGVVSGLLTVAQAFALGALVVEVATDPAGEWSEPVRVDRGGIDPSLFFDDDGKVYFTGTSAGDEPPGIYQTEIDVKTDAQRGVRPRVDGRVGRGGVANHQARARHDPALVGLHDPAVDPAAVTEVVRVEDDVAAAHSPMSSRKRRQTEVASSDVSATSRAARQAPA